MGSALHNLASSAVVAAAATLLGDKLDALPHAALASVVFVALKSMLQFSRAVYLFRVSRPEFAIWVGSFLATLALVWKPPPPPTPPTSPCHPQPRHFSPAAADGRPVCCASWPRRA